MSTNDPCQRLRKAYLLLLSDKEYRFYYQRIGAPAMENAGDDPNEKPDPLDRLVNFRAAVTAGVIPDMNTLIYVANCFAKYIESKGEMKLDQAFGLASKQRAGHPLQKKKMKDEKDEFCRRMAEYRANNPETKLDAAATGIANEQCPSSPDRENYADTMLRYYHAEGWSKLEKMMEGGRIRIEPYHPPERK